MVMLMSLRLMAEPLESVGEGDIEVAKVDGGVPCRRVGEGDIDVADVDFVAPCRSVGEGDIEVAKVDGEGTFSGMLENVMLMSPRSMTKVPSPESMTKVPRECNVDVRSLSIPVIIYYYPEGKKPTMIGTNRQL